MKNIQLLGAQDYLNIAKRRTSYILLPSLICALLTFVIVKRLPDVFVSETLILVEPSKVPTDYVRPTSVGTVQSRLSTITQQIMSRTRLEKIILDNNLYSEKRKRLPMEEIIEGMRKDIDLTVIRSDAFRLSYQANNPVLAQKVTTQIAALYIEENLKMREEETQGVNDFLESQLAETKQKLLELEKKLGDFKVQNMGALPEQEQANLSALNRLQQQLQASNDSVNRLQEQKLYQQRLLTEMKSSRNTGTVALITRALSPATVPQHQPSELETKTAERERLLRRYTKDHPDVRKLDAEIARLKESQPAQPVTPDGPQTPAPPPEDPIVAQNEAEMIRIKGQIDVLDEQIKRGLAEQEKIRGEMEVYKARVDAVPRVEQMQVELTRDYSITNQHYQQLLGKKNDAEMAISLEQRQKGEQFRIIDPASFPEKPAKPNRLLLTLGGFALGLGLGIGTAILLELFDESVRSEHELGRLTNLPILVSIPEIKPEGLDALAGNSVLRIRQGIQRILSFHSGN